ncbi:hypothetical protein GUITHDRAFT_109463 [Guillardia theta CCMP2712]|uniref:Uncharacterized protein n=1 Tax=Guillardia theta (strain CCMP2712) TaxID=905079 RepID=L1J9A3_GUITC|nr:hypothetical protein GUITHDRAFT_109463 [Guillardia theta CCMP2712]EKX44684.1 hypothetical protein GUITHDRAFT_109463 [Guillardia theta CCMP2712]|eukprot:XP_005831664.1 hypothetical protein GUITHDRAFT_109463 [Guillardia theta CCMP2712]
METPWTSSPQQLNSVASSLIAAPPPCSPLLPNALVSPESHWPHCFPLVSPHPRSFTPLPKKEPTTEPTMFGTIRQARMALMLLSTETTDALISVAEAIDKTSVDDPAPPAVDPSITAEVADAQKEVDEEQKALKAVYSA